MRGLLSFVVVCLTGTFSLSAQRIASTPPGPVNVFKAKGLMHVLCTRNDVNFNDVSDEGDSPASWVQFDPSTLQMIRTHTFPWTLVGASRVGVSESGDALYVGVGNTVEKFVLSTQESQGSVYTGPVSSVSTTTGGSAIFVSQRPSFTDPGMVVQVSLESGDSVQYQAGPNPQQSMRYTTSSNVQCLLVLSEGNFGQPTGLFDIWKQTQLGSARTSIVVGDTPNHFTVSGDSAYITVNGSHWVVVVDLLTNTAVDTIPTGTSGFDGPREALINNGLLYVSTFAGDVRIFNIATGQRIGSVLLDAKPEGIAINGRDLWVTRAFVAGGYAVERNVAVYDLDQAVSVAEGAPFSLSTPRAIYAPGSRLTLPFDVSAQITLSTLEGRRTAVQTVDSGSCTIDVSSLPTGVYVVSDGTSAITLMR
ncbi:MAG TPA: hypothetical protein VK147_02535 [Candidatus Didemnitutus sp.]|nr:hypothetical protein [Candidatus Didemnitutus sp.]